MPLDQVDVDKLGPDNLPVVSEEKEMSFLDHLEELRWHIVRSVVSIFIFGIITFLAKDFVFNTLIAGPKSDWFPTYRMLCGLTEGLCFKPPKFDLITVGLGESFIVHLKASFFLGLTISFPYIFWEMWKFIKPGLYDDEKQAARGMVFVCSFLFVMGVCFGYFVVAPVAVSFLAGYDVGAISTVSITSYVNYLTMFTIPVGIIFELPVLVYFLAKVGLISAAFMRKYRRHAIVLILVLSAFITPPDVVTQFLIGIPLFFLYEISIIIAKRMEAKRAKEIAND